LGEFSEEDIESTGLFEKNALKISQRIVIPYMHWGKPVYLAARACKVEGYVTSKQIPKYLYPSSGGEEDTPVLRRPLWGADTMQRARNVIITEGDPDEEVGSVTVQNSGAFGSFMGVTATPSAPWLTVSPSSAQGVGRGETVTFDLSISTATLLASGSPYAGVVNLQDYRSSPTVIPITVTVTVLPRPVITTSPSQIDLTYVLSTSTAGPPKVMALSNSGPTGSQLDYTIAKLNNNSPWLSISPLSGGPLAAGDSEQITFSVVSSQAPAVPGTYQETVRISSPNASNSPVDVVVQLVVT